MNLAFAEARKLLVAREKSSAMMRRKPAGSDQQPVAEFYGAEYALSDAMRAKLPSTELYRTFPRESFAELKDPRLYNPEKPWIDGTNARITITKLNRIRHVEASTMPAYALPRDFVFMFDSESTISATDASACRLLGVSAVNYDLFTHFDCGKMSSMRIRRYIGLPLGVYYHSSMLPIRNSSGVIVNVIKDSEMAFVTIQRFTMIRNYWCCESVPRDKRVTSDASIGKTLWLVLKKVEDTAWLLEERAREDQKRYDISIVERAMVAGVDVPPRLAPLFLAMTAARREADQKKKQQQQQQELANKKQKKQHSRGRNARAAIVPAQVAEGRMQTRASSSLLEYSPDGEWFSRRRTDNDDGAGQVTLPQVVPTMTSARKRKQQSLEDEDNYIRASVEESIVDRKQQQAAVHDILMRHQQQRTGAPTSAATPAKPVVVIGGSAGLPAVSNGSGVNDGTMFGATTVSVGQPNANAVNIKARDIYRQPAARERRPNNKIWQLVPYVTDGERPMVSEALAEGYVPTIIRVGVVHGIDTKIDSAAMERHTFPTTPEWDVGVLSLANLYVLLTPAIF